MTVPLSLLNQGSGAPLSAVYPQSLFGYYDTVIPVGGSVVLKHRTSATNEPISDTWIMGLNPVMSFCLSVSSNCSLLIELVTDGTNYYAMNPILLTAGVNYISGLPLPGPEVKLVVWGTAGITVEGFIRMAAL